MATYDGERHRYRPRQPVDGEACADLETYPAGREFDALVIRDPGRATAWVEGWAVDLKEAR